MCHYSTHSIYISIHVRKRAIIVIMLLNYLYKDVHKDFSVFIILSIKDELKNFCINGKLIPLLPFSFLQKLKLKKKQMGYIKLVTNTICPHRIKWNKISSLYHFAHTEIMISNISRCKDPIFHHRGWINDQP